jgi:F420-non-reducing hydrogenase large subunit
MRRITIEPITRLEGEAKIEIFLNEEGDVAEAFFQVVELRGFERFCEGRPVEEMPRITPRICGVCPGAHHMASTKALDAVFGVEPTSAARKIRELFYCAHMLHSHIAHFYYLAAPDFILGPAAEPAKRNVLGVIEAVGLDIGKKVITARNYAQEIQKMIGGKATHPVFGLPGGVSKPISEDERRQIEEMARALVEFGKFGLELFDELILSRKELTDLITGDIYRHETYYMGMVDENNKVNFYDGDIRVVDQEGNEVVRFKPEEYLNHIGEHVEPWSYLKFPYLKAVGWKGLVDGKESGIYRVNSLARLNVADGMATPLAQEAYEKLFDVLGEKPSHATLAFNWARLVEIMYAAERLLDLATDDEITSKNVRIIPQGIVGEGVGCVEAPRGTLFHHYWTDDEGVITRVNLIVATGQNNAGMCMSIKKAAQSLIKKGQVDQGLLNMVEMAFRAYDPCLACATHALFGQMPLEVVLRDIHGNIMKKLVRR